MMCATSSLSTRLIAPSLVALALATSSHANGVRIVDAVGDRNYASIHTAIEDAQPGDILLVAAGVYSGFIVDKPVTVVATPQGADVRIVGSVEIDGVVGGPATLIGLNHQSNGHDALTISNSQEVRLRDCELVPDISGYDGFHGIVISSTDSVVLDSCIVRGGPPSSYDIPWSKYGFHGGTGIYATDSTLAIYSSEVTGAFGAQGYENGGDGGHGIFLVDSFLFLSGSNAAGADGGSWTAPHGDYGADGWGVHGGGESTVVTLDSTVAGFSNNRYAEYIFVSGTHRAYSVPTLSTGNGPILGTVSGEPGDRAEILLSPVSAFQYAAGLLGVWHIAPLQFLPIRVPTHTIPNSGILEFEFSLPTIASRQVARHVYAQGLTYAWPFRPRLGNPLDVIQLDRNATPDCNQNGILDYVEIIEGSALDLDQNLIPDSCQHSGPTWHVDANAQPGGNGSPQAPFVTIGAALAQASDGGTVLVEDGVYTGPNNRNLLYQGSELIVRSVNGAANCIIDCEGLGRGFRVPSQIMTDYPVESYRIEGFTIRRGNVVGQSVLLNGDYGGGILVGANWMPDRSVIIKDCVIEQCAADRGAGITNSFNGTQIIGCTFRDNAGFSTLELYGDIFVTNSLIENNDSIGIAVRSSFPYGYTVVLSHCLVKGNADGGINVRGGASIDNCIIENNTAERGAGIHAQFLYEDVSIRNCTVVGNHATEFGGALYLDDSYPAASDFLVANSIFWNNTSESSLPFHLAGISPRLEVDSCDIEGGLGSFELAASSPLLEYRSLIDADPLFVDLVDYRLTAGSPCIDAGSETQAPRDRADMDNDGNTTETTPFDIDGEARVQRNPNPAVSSGPVFVREIDFPTRWIDIGADERTP